MRLGLVARADNTGLGNQTLEFYRHMNPDKVMVVDIGSLNGMVSNYDWYPNAQIVRGFPNRGDIDAFLDGLDVVFVAETPYNYYLYEKARQMGVKTVQQYNYEFLDYLAYPNYPNPDMLLAPSKWNYDKVQVIADQRGIKHMYLHCPVNRQKLQFRKIDSINKFLHIAGRPAAHDRNGTNTVIDAAPYMGSTSVVITCQNQAHLNDYMQRSMHENIEYILSSDIKDYSELYDTADALVFPRRYGGNCLPMNEALSCGMPVMMTDISPNNQFLPRPWLTEAHKVGEFRPRTVIDIYETDPKVLGETMRQWANLSIDDTIAMNNEADKLAESVSWETLKPQYDQMLRDLCAQ